MKSRTENMLIDIDSIDENLDAALEIPFLRQIDSWAKFTIGLIPKPKLLQYLVVLYSHDSFLNTRNPIPLADRKQRALKFAGIKNTNDVTNELLLLENELILKMILDFLIAQKNNLWTEIITTEEQYEEAIKLRLKPIKADKGKDELGAAALKKNLRIDCKEMQGDLDAFYRKFFQDHTDVRDQIRVKATTLEMLSTPTDYVEESQE